MTLSGMCRIMKAQHQALKFDLLSANNQAPPSSKFGRSLNKNNNFSDRYTAKQQSSERGSLNFS